MSKKKEVLLLFSGGRDSFLSACILIENGYKVYIVTFENGLGLKAHNAEHGAKRIIKKYGQENVVFLGIQNVSSIWRDYFLPYFNMKPTEILKEYGELPISQFHCLTCRMAMYVWCIIKAKQANIKFIADGARKDQHFVIELPSFINKLKDFLLKYKLELLLPVFELDSTHKTKNLLLLRGFVPKVLEPQCMLGVPFPDDNEPDTAIQNAVIKYFLNVVVPRSHILIKENANTYIDKSGKII